MLKFLKKNVNIVKVFQTDDSESTKVHLKMNTQGLHIKFQWESGNFMYSVWVLGSVLWKVSGQAA